MSKPFTILKLDKDYEFRISNRTAYTYEQLSGKTLTEISEKFGIIEMNHLVYAGLKSIDKDITLDKVIEVIDLIEEYITLEDLSNVIEKAMAQSHFFKTAKS
jgi:5'(3')-deoxyribonucleotidase